jgi:hypothetical protein
LCAEGESTVPLENQERDVSATEGLPQQERGEAGPRDEDIILVLKSRKNEDLDNRELLVLAYKNVGLERKRRLDWTRRLGREKFEDFIPTSCSISLYQYNYIDTKVNDKAGL